MAHIPPRAAAIALAALALFPAIAHGLALDSATVSIDPARTDRFQLAGHTNGLALDGIDHLTLSFDRFTFDVPVDDAARKHHKLTYRSPAPGLTHFVLDLRKRHVTATGAGLALSGLPQSPRRSSAAW